MSGSSGTSLGPVLITGCSSGIGHAAALRLHAAGLQVYATARRVETLEDLAGRGIHTMPLDVTDEASMIRAVAAIEGDAGPVGVLINNAGYGLYGPVEQQPMAEIRRQFETNFFGLVRLTQLVLPGMRRARRGRILNVSSMGGRATLPGGAFYHASKYAVEALSDALRMEVAQFGIDVVLIEPGPVKTPWNDVAAASLATAVPSDATSATPNTPATSYATAPAADGAGGAGTRAVTGPRMGAGSAAEAAAEPGTGTGTGPRTGPDAEPDVRAAAEPGTGSEAAAGDPYAAYKAAVGASFATAHAGPLARLGSNADDIAKVITSAVTARRPRTRYLINPLAKSVVAMNQLLPGRAYDAVLRWQYRLPR